MEKLDDQNKEIIDTVKIKENSNSENQNTIKEITINQNEISNKKENIEQTNQDAKDNISKHSDNNKDNNASDANKTSNTNNDLNIYNTPIKGIIKSRLSDTSNIKKLVIQDDNDNNQKENSKIDNKTSPLEINIQPNSKLTKVSFDPKANSNKDLPIGKKKLSITDFKITQTLGKGAFGKVVLAEHKGKNYALKVLDKKFMEKYEKIHEVHTEKQILSLLNHRNIIKLHSTFQDSKSLYFVLDYCPNKDLAEFLKMNVVLSKELAQFYSAEIVCVMDYLRKNGISHRDLKPENIMLDEQMKIKVVSNIRNTKFLNTY